MDAYTSFASVYDLFMDDIPYGKWCAYLTGLLKAHGVKEGLVLELGCGTGSLTQLLASEGYDMIGVDNSGEMLSVAVEKNSGTDYGILYLQQDMRDFELYGTVAAAVSICDSMNYILEYSDLVRVCSLVNNYLDPKGVFIFDLNTVYKYETVLGESTIAENREEESFIWDNYYDAETRINEYGLTLFIREEAALYRRYDETHYQRAYTLEEIKEAVREAGMEFVTAYDAFTRNPPSDQSERIYVIARECGK